MAKTAVYLMKSMTMCFFRSGFSKPVRASLRAAAQAILLVACISCSHTPQQQAAKFLARGKERIKKKEYSAAILDLKNVARLQPNSSEAFYQLGLAYLSAGDFRSAYSSLVHATELNPKHTDAQLKLAEMLSSARGANKGILEQAEKRAETILSVTPDNADALTALGFAEMRLGKKEDAAKHLEAALDKLPRDLQAATALAGVKLAGNDTVGAEQVLKKVVERAPRSPDAQIALGRFYVMLRRAPDAEAAFQRALAIDPKNGPALLDLAQLQLASNRSDEAEKTYQRVAALPDKRLHPIHAVFLFQGGQRDAAIKEFERLAEQDPKDHDAKIRLIRAYLITRHLPESERELNALLKQNPKDMAALVERGRLYVATARIQEAERDLNQVLSQEPHSVMGRYLLSKVHEAQGATDLRRQELRDVLKEDPSFLQARLELAQLSVGAKGANEALEILGQAPNAQQRLPAFIVQKDRALFAAGDQSQLRKSIDDGLAIQKDPELLLQDGLLRLQKKDFVGARKSLEAVVQAKPQDARAIDELAKTYLLEKKPAAAIAVVRGSAGKYPRSAALQLLLGGWLEQMKQPADARKAYLAALAVNPALMAAKLRLANLDLAEGKLDSARKMLASVAATPAGKSPGEMLLGMLEERPGGDVQTAISHYRKAVDADPNNVMALNNLAYHLATDAKQFDEALKLAQHAKELSTDSAVVDDTIGWAFYQKGLYVNAVKQFQDAVAKEPNARREYHLAMAYFKAGDAPHARSTIAEARKMDAAIPEAVAAGQLIEGAERRR
jgi:tetratricopeptide (TPR) repeat protein